MDISAAPIGFAVVGYGRIGKRHAALIDSHPEARLRALVDVNGKEIEGVPLFPSLEALLASPLSEDIQVVDIATPNGLHATQACLALENGKHVVVEKPLALTKSDGEKILTSAAANARQVFVVLQNRYAAPAQWLKRLVDSGSLGHIHMVQIDGYWNRDERYYSSSDWHGTKTLDGGVLFTQFSHFVDMIYWLFGDIKDIRGRFANFAHGKLTDFADSGMIHFSLASGGIGSLNVSTAVWDKNLESSLTIIAEFGSVRLSGQYMERVEYCHIRDGGWTPPLAPEGPARDPEANHRKVIWNVMDVLKGRASSDTDPADALKVVDIIERMYNA
jgi:UDP-N-acetyl-2-amino-2-deoxyglucuronate dehydrogenase